MILELIDEAVAAGARLHKACHILGLTARTHQRWKALAECEDRRQTPKMPVNELTDAEREKLLAVLNSTEYRDLSPNQIVPRLADEGTYLASESTMYRLLRAEKQLAHRSTSKPPVRRERPDHLAIGPNQVWSWDITYMKGPVRGSFFYLYLIVDVFSRRIMGWDVHAEESPEHAAALLARSCSDNGIDPDGIVLHSDNGGPMKGATMLSTMQWLGIVPSFSRPGVSDDNPFSEALFRTLKYRPTYPDGRFGSLEEARAWVARFVAWYNAEHRHSGIKFVTPDDRHFGREQAILARRHGVYLAARRKHPRRWSAQTRDWTPSGAVRLSSRPNPESEPLRSTRPPSPQHEVASSADRVKAAAGARAAGLSEAKSLDAVEHGATLVGRGRAQSVGASVVALPTVLPARAAGGRAR